MRSASSAPVRSCITRYRSPVLSSVPVSCTAGIPGWASAAVVCTSRRKRARAFSAARACSARSASAAPPGPPVGAENLRHLGRCFAGRRRLGHAKGAWRAGLFGLACDDLRLVGLNLIFLVVTRSVSVLGLSRREDWWKDAEILMLHHQLAVALRERPRAHSRLTWPDRAWLALLAGTLPAGRLAELRLIVTRPRFCAGTATLSAAGGRGCPAKDVPAGRRCAALCGRWCSGWRGRTSHGGTGGSTVSLPGSASSWRRRRCGRSSRTPRTGPAPRRD